MKKVAAIVLLIGGILFPIRLSATVGDDDTYEIGWVEAPKSFVVNMLYKFENNEWDKIKKGQPSYLSPANLLTVNKVTNRLITLTNPRVKFYPIFILLQLLATFILVYSIKKKDHSYDAITLVLTSASFIGLFLFLPNATDIFTLLVIDLILFISLFSMLLESGFAALNRKKRHGKKMVYGPQITVPTGKDKVFVIGKEKTSILPSNVQWLSNGSGDDIRIPYGKLTQGLSIIGDMGSGKTRLMMKIHDELRASYPNIPILIHDPKGEWYKTYFNPKTDIVFSPHLENSITWDILNDFKNHPELLYEVINTAVYSRQNKDDQFWSENAVSLLKSAFSNSTIQEVIDYLQYQKTKNGDDKFFLSVYGTAKLAALDVLKIAQSSEKASDRSKTFSIEDFLNHKGRIFLINNPAFAAEQRGILNLFLSMFFLRAISKDDVEQGGIRVAAIIDEILSFNMPPDVSRRIFTISRSKGLAIISGAQRLPKENRNEMSDWQNAEFLFAMKVVDIKTQETFSKRAGSFHYDMKVESKGKNGGGKSSSSESTTLQRDKVIQPEAFGNLKQKQFILFHQEGITPGETVDVINKQSNIPIPKYDPKPEYNELSMKLD